MSLQERIEGTEPEVRMSFGEHLEELRVRLFRSVVFLLVMAVVALVFYNELASFITAPHFRAMKMLGISQEKSRFLSATYTGPPYAMMKLSLIVALFASSPWIGYQLWAFVSAGLYRNERKYVARFAPASFLLFTAGCAFGYLVLVPYGLYGLVKMLDLDIISPTYSFSEYLSLVTALTIILGCVFQLPLVMIFFAIIGLVRPSTYNKWRRAAIVGIAVFAAIITPADCITIFLVGVPMWLLYEIGVVVSYIAVRKRKDAKTP